MPTFKINREIPRGDFTLTFNSGSSVDFYGFSVPEFEAFRYYGALPDNNVGINKLINILGRHLLNLEDDGDAFEQDSSTLSQEKYHLNQVERLSTAMSIKLLDAFSELEAVRNYPPSDQKIVFDDCKKNVQKIYKTHLEQLSNLAIGATGYRHDRINQLIQKIKAQEAQLAALKQPKKVDETFLRSLYQGILDDFSDVQSTITLHQRPFLKTAVFANQSETEAYQDASYALEAHVFGHTSPTFEQLWKSYPVLDISTPDIAVSTDRLEHIRPDVALKAGIRVMTNQQSVPTKQKDYRTFFPDPQHQPPASTPRLQFLHLKETIRAVTIEEKKKRAALVDNNDEGKIYLRNKFHTSSDADNEAYNALVLIDPSIAFEARTKAQIQSLIETLRKPGETLSLPLQHALERLDAVVQKMKDPLSDFTDLEQALSKSKANKGNKTIFLKENPLELSVHTDLFSIIGSVCAGLTKNFESQMTAKHPMVTSAFYLTSAFTLTVAGLNAAVLNKAWVTMPDFIQRIAKFLLSANPNTLEVLIKDGIVLPKLIFDVTDALMNSRDNEATITHLFRQQFPDSFDGVEIADFIESIVQNILILGISMSISYGIQLSFKECAQLLAAMNTQGYGEALTDSLMTGGEVGLGNFFANTLIGATALWIAEKSMDAVTCPGIFIPK